MNCPQCGADVPSDNAFCGKCGYAMRDEEPQRTDQSRIRMHEEPTPANRDAADKRPSSPRIRKRTVLGMPPVSREEASPPPPAEQPVPPPASITSARARKSPQKTMLGIPRPELPDPPLQPSGGSAPPDEDAPGDPIGHGGRQRAHVRYDSVLEPPPVAMRRRRFFVAIGMLVVLSGAWLVYRVMNG